MKKLLAMLLALALCLSVGFALAEGETLTPGVTVAADENSPTGYTATFVYENAEAQSVSLGGNFGYYTSGHLVATVPAEEDRIDPADFVPGMFRANSTDLAVWFPMEKVEGTDFWTVSLTLPSGLFTYNYKVDEAEETITDPANPPLTPDTASGNTAKLSTFVVPYAEKQGATLNFDYLLPREDGQAGTLDFAEYTDVNGNTAPLIVYLPYGYDAAREEPYKVLYLSHGGGGNETEWFSSGNTDKLFDNMIAAGTVEPTIVVTMSNGVYDWDYDVINDNVMNHIIPFMEENYNVSAEPAGRAFAGLSMGAMTTTNMFYRSPDQFGYFGIFSGSDCSWDFANSDAEALLTPTIMFGAGCYDMAYVNFSTHTDGDISTFGALEKFTEQGIDYDFYEVDGGHDWSTWPQLLKIFAETYLWK